MKGRTRKKIRRVLKHPNFPKAFLLLLIFLGLLAIAARDDVRQDRIYSTTTITGIDADIVIIRSETVPGGVLEYNVRLVNNLDHSVPFNIAVLEPLGWRSNYQKYVEVSSGDEVEVPIEVTPPVGASAGEYQFEIIVTTKAETGWKKVL